MPVARHVQVLIVGSGFAGLGAAIRLDRAGYRDFLVIERAGEVGGTWRDNTYPGAACDVPSHLYSFSFAPNPEWSRTYSPGAEIQRYLRRTAERSGTLDRHLFRCELLSARWDAQARRWVAATTRGTFTCTVLVTAFGGLCEPRLPDIPGLRTFTGSVFHSARWDHRVELAGRRVAIIGTGASAIQAIPEIAAVAGHLDVYQRTASWVLPRRIRTRGPAAVTATRVVPGLQRLLRGLTYARLEITSPAFSRAPWLMRPAELQARRQLRAQVADPRLRARLTPDHRLGCKRVLFSTDFYPALTRPTVDLVTTPIREIAGGQVVTADGGTRPAEVLILATGFHTTDSPAADLITGADGRTLGEYWREIGQQAYKGSTVHGFPNLFLLIGPNVGTGNMSMVAMIESQLNYLLDALRVMDRYRISTVEVLDREQSRFNDRLQRRMGRTVWASGCRSWYLDARGVNTVIWPGFAFSFRAATRRFDLHAYRITGSSSV